MYCSTTALKSLIPLQSTSSARNWQKSWFMQLTNASMSMRFDILVFINWKPTKSLAVAAKRLERLERFLLRNWLKRFSQLYYFFVDAWCLRFHRDFVIKEHKNSLKYWRSWNLFLENKDFVICLHLLNLYGAFHC